MLDRPAGPRLPTTVVARAQLAARLGPLGPRCRSARNRCAALACHRLSRRAASCRLASALAASGSLKHFLAECEGECGRRPEVLSGMAA